MVGWLGVLVMGFFWGGGGAGYTQEGLDDVMMGISIAKRDGVEGAGGKTLISEM